MSGTRSRLKKTLLSIWVLSILVTFASGGGFATRYVAERAEGKFIPYTEELNSIDRIVALTTEDGHVVSICFNALLAYTTDSADYQIEKHFETDFTGWGTSSVPRAEMTLDCETSEASVALLEDALAGRENESEPYYRLGGIYCEPGRSSSMLALGCFVNPQQEWGRVTIALEAPEFQYTHSSAIWILMPAAWIADVIIAPVYAIYYLSLLVMYLLWAISGGVPATP